MKSIIYHALILLGLTCVCLLIWFAGPMIGFGETHPFEGFWTRFFLVALIVTITGTVYGLRYLKKRKAQKALEESIAEVEPESQGDAPVLAERLGEALQVLKASNGGKNALYDLPWYVVIGPPGAGKTTALVNSGLKFPLMDRDGGRASVQGIGGTRYCDWWFAEDAVIVDTAGRYTTQDSDESEDKKSWMSFLSILKKHRTKQPINGVILAISIEDILSLDAAELEAHSAAIRARLFEISEQLKIEFPVYAVFTKADLIAGFTEFFGHFTENQRRQVWGATFQTENKTQSTVDDVPNEFDLLVNRLTEEITDRLHEENYGLSRVAIVGFPSQFAMLRDNVAAFLSSIFAPNRYQTSANLRGFYFTSGTQEGTPIDQALGAMARDLKRDDAESFLSGKGKSFFLHDLLTKVIFAESGWVSYDKAALLRHNISRYGALAAVLAVSLALVGVWSLSFYQNRSLIGSTERAVASYRIEAKDELSNTVISDHDFEKVDKALEDLRKLPTGYEEREESTPVSETFGLSQRPKLNAAAVESYRGGLERMFRSRLIFRLEKQIEDHLSNNDPIANYEALKVYLMLGNAAKVVDEELIKAWIEADWREVLYPGPASRPLRESLQSHLKAMLDLDDGQRATYVLNETLVDSAQKSIARMKVVDQAYALLKSSVHNADVIEDFVLQARAGQDADQVFETIDGTPLSDIRIPYLFTYRGFHEYLLGQLAAVANKLQEESWVMGKYAQTDAIEAQFKSLGPQLLDKYGQEFVAQWQGMLANLKFRPFAADKPAYRALDVASAPLSPVKTLFRAVADETKLTVERAQQGGLADALTNASGGGGSVASEAADIAARRIRDRANGLSRIGLDMAIRRSKSQRRAGSGAAPRIPGANIEAQFARYHDLVDGEEGRRPIDALVDNYAQIFQSLTTINTAPNQADAANTNLRLQLSNLQRSLSRLPNELSRMVKETLDDFQGDAANSTIAQLNQELATSVTGTCQRVIANRYPFARRSSRDVPMADFARLFAPNGIIDSFFLQKLAPYVDVTGKRWRWRPEAFNGRDLSKATLRNFQRAAEIRDAFFPAGGTMPGIGVGIHQTGLHGSAESALLSINGSVLQSGQVAKGFLDITWPGSSPSGSVHIQLSPEIFGRRSSYSMVGPWAFFRFVEFGRPKRIGDTVNVRYTIGGRNVSYGIRVNSLYNPFSMRALSDFSCPRGL